VDSEEAEVPAVRTLIVQHVPKSKRPAFTVIRCDPSDTTPDAAKITPPEEFGTKELPGSHLRRELRWYLEQFLDYPFPPNTDRADRVTQVLEAWGTHAFQVLFLAGKGRDWYHNAVRDGTEHLQLRIIANEPTVLAWPWEALHDPERGYLAHKCHIERQLNNVADPPPLPENLPRDRLNILLVTARPFEGDVEYRSISRALVEQIEANRLTARVTVLRPPTFDALREELGRRPGYYHILHFDGHGGYGVIADEAQHAATLANAVNPHAFKKGPQGCLVFETPDGRPHPVPAETLSATLHEFRIPMVVLNACQSGTIDENAENAFASVAASLIRAGIRSVVAMAWSLYVSGAQQFLPAFYKRLLETGNLAEPTQAGRAAMFAHPGRVCARGTYPLKDWLVPVVYQQQPADLSFVTQAKPKEDQQTTALPEEATDKENPYGFIGRDSALLALERALLRDPPAILIHGLGGVGKTTLARGFLQWLRQTEGLGAGCLWFTFNDIHTAEYVLNAIGTAISDSRFITLDTEQKLTALGQILRENRLILVWDNFESASGNEAAGIAPLLRPDDLQLLRRFLQAFQGGRSKVLVTSRSEESWLPAHLRYKLPLGGLTGESRWEFCTAILRNLGIQTNRADPDLAALVDTLDGHPLLMRAVLPRLEGGRSAQSILQELQGNLAADGTGADPTQKKVYATLRFVEDSLPKELRVLLVPLALHERFVDADIMELMAKQAGQTDATRTRIDGLLAALAGAGLLRERRSNTIFELHPALTGFLRATVVKQTSRQLIESWQRAFVEILGELANKAAPKPLDEQRGPFFIHGANFQAALSIAEALNMHLSCAALSQSLANYALNTRSLDNAERLFKRLVEYSELVEDPGIEASAYHQLGMIAEERRDFETAEKWYCRALGIDEKQGDERSAADTYHQLDFMAVACYA